VNFEEIPQGSSPSPESAAGIGVSGNGTRGQTAGNLGAPGVEGASAFPLDLHESASDIFAPVIPETSGSPTSYAIELDTVTKTYGEKNAVDALTLRVPQGCFYGFLGANGAGKTTTIKMLMGLAAPTSGTLTLLGVPVAKDSFEVRRRIGVVLDDSLLFDRLTGREYLQFVGRIYGLDRDVVELRVRELLDLFDLTASQHKVISEYSKGMKKRVAMGAALIHRPSLFLMDEPFEGVDAMGARLMKEILLDRVKHGCTVFLTSHVLEVVERLCDRLAIIHEGKLVVEGTMDDLRAGGSAHDTLEEVFVRTIGGDTNREMLDWL
jgi:ABC-2 type transport system ATP-binding protein